MLKWSTVTYKAIIIQKGGGREGGSAYQCQVTPQGTKKVLTKKILTAIKARNITITFKHIILFH